MRTTSKPAHLGLALVALLVSVVGCTDNPPRPPRTHAPVALGPVEVTGVGDVAQGKVSGNDLVLRFTEASPAAIAAGSGSFEVTLTDQSGSPDTIGFAGTPSIEAPGSLGASVTLTGPNVLTVSIVDSDMFNIEPMTINGLGVRAAANAALGSINGFISGCSGSLAGCTALNELSSPGTVVAAH